MTDQEQKPMVSFKCVLLGDNGPMKEAFLERLLDGGFSQKDVNCQGVEIRPLVFYTTRGALRFCLWDVAGEEKYETLRKGSRRIQAECVFILFDTETSCHGNLLKAYKATPTIICGKKSDLKDLIRIKTKSQYFLDISSTNKFNLLYPFLWLGAKLLGDLNLEVVEMPALMPPEVKLTKEQKLQMERDLEEAQLIPLPEDPENL